MGKAASLARQFSLGLKPRPLPELLAAGRMLQACAPPQPSAQLRAYRRMLQSAPRLHLPLHLGCLSCCRWTCPITPSWRG